VCGPEAIPTLGTLIAFSAVQPVDRTQTGKREMEGETNAALEDFMLVHAVEWPQDPKPTLHRLIHHRFHLLEELRGTVRKRVGAETA
jgi:hypothetical protein